MTELQLGYLEEVLDYLSGLIEQTLNRHPLYGSPAVVDDTDAKFIKSKIVQVRRGIKQERNILAQSAKREEGGSEL